VRGDFRGCRYFVMFRPPSLLAPQIVPTAANAPAGQPGLLRPSRTRFVTSPRIGYANRPMTGNWRYGDLHPARLRPCRLLLSSIPPIIPYGELSPVRLEGWPFRWRLPRWWSSLSLLPAYPGQRPVCIRPSCASWPHRWHRSASGLWARLRTAIRWNTPPTPGALARVRVVLSRSVIT
jgi:hypothetical protein